MGYIPLDRIVRSAIANQGHSTLHLYVPYLHWGFEALEKFHEDGYYTDLRHTKIKIDEDNTAPFPEDMLMWSKVGVVSNGHVHVFTHDQSLSLDPEDIKNPEPQDVARGLYSASNGILTDDWLYNTNIYVSTQDGIVVSGAGGNLNFKANWSKKVFQINRNMGESELYIEYVAQVHNPTTETLVNEVARRFIEAYIYYREARFKHGAAHRETQGAHLLWLDEQDDLRASLSDLTANGIVQAMNQHGTRYSIDQ